MAVYSYLTIAAPSAGAHKEKGSKFLSFAYPITNEEDAREKLQVLRKQYFDARHHCFAYVLGAGKEKFRLSDDGEPTHSAGDPILGQIRSRGITNVLVAVVRYFGGVKLGVGGLTGAYKLAAGDALNNAAIISREVTRTIRIVYGYAATPEVMKLLRDFDLHIESQSFEETCELTATVALRNEQALREKTAFLIATGNLQDVQFD